MQSILLVLYAFAFLSIYYDVYVCINSRATQTAWSIIAREQAPATATEDMFVPDDVSSTVGRFFSNLFIMCNAHLIFAFASMPTYSLHILIIGKVTNVNVLLYHCLY